MNLLSLARTLCALCVFGVLAPLAQAQTFPRIGNSTA